MSLLDECREARPGWGWTETVNGARAKVGNGVVSVRRPDWRTFAFWSRKGSDDPEAHSGAHESAGDALDALAVALLEAAKRLEAAAAALAVPACLKCNGEGAVTCPECGPLPEDHEGCATCGDGGYVACECWKAAAAVVEKVDG